MELLGVDNILRVLESRLVAWSRGSGLGNSTAMESSSLGRSEAMLKMAENSVRSSVAGFLFHKDDVSGIWIPLARPF